MEIKSRGMDRFVIDLSGDDLTLMMLLINEAPTCFTDEGWGRVGDNAYDRLEEICDLMAAALSNASKA